MKRAEPLTPNRLRKHRRQMGFHQRDVAFLLGLKGTGRISEWENGLSKPSLDNLLQLSILYRTLPDELYYDVRQEFVKDMEKRLRDFEATRDSGG